MSGSRRRSQNGGRPIREMGLDGLAEWVPQDMVVPKGTKVYLTDDGRPLILGGYWDMVAANPWLKSRSALRKEHLAPGGRSVAAGAWRRCGVTSERELVYDIYDARDAIPLKRSPAKRDVESTRPVERCPMCGRSITRHATYRRSTAGEGLERRMVDPNRIRMFDSSGNRRELVVCDECLGSLRAASAKVPRAPMDVPRSIVLDTETTGLDAKRDEILSIGVVDTTGEPIWATLVRPERTLSWPEAEKVNGLDYADVSLAPTAGRVLPVLQSIVDRATEVIGYNVDFDARFLSEAGLDLSRVRATDVMEPFARVYGERDEKHGGYKWQRLTTAADYYGYDWSHGPGAHDALADAAATAWVWRHMPHEGD